ncbi:hypothetical protein [Corynebacterium auris]|uniref:hypothetical protein n=1 Tax=Corynebacterium auris TaxID=44750 RepID=UPI0025B5A431|nr:hypothetical protein [Corynebacterium auris]WJY68617.1 hypothetical protein CAURIS_08630 [Corynebacterium auris]
MLLVSSSQTILNAGVPPRLTEEIVSVVEEVADNTGAALVAVGDSPYRAAVLRAAEELAGGGREVDILGDGARTLDDVPADPHHAIIVEALGATELPDALIDYLDRSRARSTVVSVGTPAGIAADSHIDAGFRVVRERGSHPAHGDYAHVRKPAFVRADVTVAPHGLNAAHALHPACGQVIVVRGEGSLSPDLLGQYARYNAGANPLRRPLAAVHGPRTVEPEASVRIDGVGAAARLRAEAALRAGAGAVRAGVDHPGVEPFGDARVRVSGDEIVGSFGRVLLVDGLTREEALRRARDEKAVIVVPGERALVVQPLRKQSGEEPAGIWTVHDAGVPWVDTPGGRDVLIGLIAASLAQMEVSMERFLADRPRVVPEDPSPGYAPDEAVGLYALAVGIAADGAPTTAEEILRAVPLAFREGNARWETWAGA